MTMISMGARSANNAFTAAIKRRWLLGVTAFGITALAGSSQSIFNKISKNKQNYKTNPPNLNNDLGTLCSNRNAVGTGLLGEYYGQDQCNGEPLLIKTDKSINSNNVKFEEFIRSARWRGWIKTSMSGPHQFHLNYPKSRIIVARSELSSHDENITPTINLIAGQFFNIKLELPFINKTEALQFRLEWTLPNGYRYLVPPVMLFVPSN